MKILFIGLRIDGKGWVEGDLCRFAGRHYIIPENQQFRDIEDPDFDSSFIEVTPKSVGQYTGMVDKNGKKIFGGSKILYDGIEGVVFFENGSFWLRFEYTRSVHLLGELEREIEIIGNIHEQ